MSALPPANQPADLYLLLGRIDGKVDGIAGTLAAMNTRADNHEQRINALEADSHTRAGYIPRFEAVETDVDTIKDTMARQDGRSRGWFEASGAIKAILGVLLAATAYFGYKVEFAPDAGTITAKTVETVQIPRDHNTR